MSVRTDPAAPTASAAEPRAAAEYPYRRATISLLPALGPLFVVGLLVLWEAISRSGLVNALLFPPVTTIVGRFAELWRDGTFLSHLVPTMQRMLLGYALAASIGIGLGLMMGYWSAVYDWLEPILEFLRPLPPVAVIPAFMLFLGIGDEMKIAIVLFGALWPVLLNTIDGVRGVHPTILEVARIYQFSIVRTIRSVVLPAALPQIMAGLRTALGIALIVALVSEMVGSTQGLGFFIRLSQRSFKMSDMYAGVFLLAILGYCLNRGFLAIEHRLMAWHLARTGQSE